MLLETIKIPISKLEPNEGQIPEVPTNPRTIKDGKFKKLMQSIKDDPGMLEIRELVVFPLKKKFIVLGGNMRLKACTELGYKEMYCKVLHPKTTPAQMRAIVQKDNIGYGENDWDLLANEWDEADLLHWGMDLPKDWGKTDDQEDATGSSEEEEGFKKSVVKLEIMFDDLDYYNDARKRIGDLIRCYPGAKIKE